MNALVVVVTHTTTVQHYSELLQFTSRVHCYSEVVECTATLDILKCTATVVGVVVVELTAYGEVKECTPRVQKYTTHI